MRIAILASLAAFGTLAFASTASAYTLKTLHSFCAETNCTDGISPAGPLSMDAQGNLFGVTYQGGSHHHGGTVFGLFPGAQGWTYQVLYNFCNSCARGSLPNGGLVVDASGNLYGTTQSGSQAYAGEIFELSPASGGGAWSFQKLHQFCGDDVCADGRLPSAGLAYAGQASGALYDGVSPLYGTTERGGEGGGGVVFQLAKVHGKFRESVIHTFSYGSSNPDGIYPVAPVIVDGSGNLFGTTENGGAFYDLNNGHGGIVFELKPGSGGAWSENILYSFNALPNGTDGYSPQTPVLMDQTGNLFGTTTFGGTDIQGGTAYKLTPANPTWQETVLNNFCVQANCTDGRFPTTGLLMNGAGALIGATNLGGTNAGAQNEGAGTIYQLNGSFQVIYDFCSRNHCTDGQFPDGALVMDGAGNLFGATVEGGKHRHNGGRGTIYELTP
jgi:uncharacterized repeat protein (TIGR03803 family)